MVHYLLRETVCSESDRLGPGGGKKIDDNYSTLNRYTLQWDLQHLQEVFYS